jgi:lysophospholipase L1-like esterase
MTPPGGPRRRGGELLLVAGSLLFLLAIAGIGELAVRAFSTVDLLGNSHDLFAAHAYGSSNGNAPNVEASSFGKMVYTDEYGFRVPKGGVPGDAGKHEAILILGDSVAFGPAVEEPDTFAGLLRARFPEQRVYNSAVIGYSTPDYRNVVQEFVPRHPEVTAVVLVYCLNDVTEATSEHIDRYLKEQESAPPKNLTEKLRSIRFLSDANDYLRSRSKLYLFVRHRLLRTQTRDWGLVLSLYAPEHAADVAQSARDIAGISAFLQARGIPLVVVIAPFEYQLRRPDHPETQVPQRAVLELLAKQGIDAIDARSSFDSGVPSTDYFLGYDPMHFSARGHRVMADLLTQALGRIRSGATNPARS